MPENHKPIIIPFKGKPTVSISMYFRGTDKYRWLVRSPEFDEINNTRNSIRTVVLIRGSFYLLKANRIGNRPTVFYIVKQVSKGWFKLLYICNTKGMTGAHARQAKEHLIQMVKDLCSNKTTI